MIDIMNGKQMKMMKKQRKLLKINMHRFVKDYLKMINCMM